MKNLKLMAEAAAIKNVEMSKRDFVNGFQHGYLRAISRFTPLVLIVCFMCIAFGYLLNTIIQIKPGAEPTKTEIKSDPDSLEIVYKSGEQGHLIFKHSKK